MSMSVYSVILLLGCFLYATAFPEPAPVYNPHYPLNVIRPIYQPDIPPKIIHSIYNPVQPPKLTRLRRFVGGTPGFNPNVPQQKRPDWEVKPDLRRDDRGNTRGEVTIQKHGDNHDFEAGWGQNIRGPDKRSGTWHVGGSIRW